MRRCYVSKIGYQASRHLNNAITRLDRSNSSSATFRWQHGAVGLIAVSMFCTMCNYNEEQERLVIPSQFLPLTASIVLCEESRQEQSTSFQVMAALEMKDEVQRIRLAQILHDLHEVAQQYGANVKRQGTMRRLWKILRQPFLSQEEQAPAVAVVPILSAVHDFGNMTLEQAQVLIDELASKQGKFEPACLLSLLQTATEILRKDDTLVDLKGVADKVTIVGDLHGSLSSLNFVLQLLQQGEIGNTTAVVFDGDFVDRGHESLEVICILLLLKLAYPKHVFLLRGNHEDVLVSSAYGFQDELEEKYGADHSEALWDAFDAIFCALPIFAVTETAAIVHGGLPSKHFKLDDVKAISTEQRCQIKSTVEPKTEIGKLMQGLLWSDPTTKHGIRPNTTRTIGVFYGPDVVADFLSRHDLKYLIRAHEVAEEGAKIIDCGAGRSVMTVFSHSEYPNGEGTNLGAFVNLHKDGEYELVKFSRDTKLKQGGNNNNNNNNNQLNPKDPYVGTLKSLIVSNKHKLEKMFSSMAPNGSITPSKWAEVMAKSLELPEVPWLVLIPSLVPQTNHNGVDTIDWRAFLQLYSSSVVADKQTCQENHIIMEILYANHQMLMTVFKFLDFDGNGSIDVDEFKTGVDILNKRLPEDRQLKNPEALFRQIDRDGNGIIDLDEFEEVFKLL